MSPGRKVRLRILLTEAEVEQLDYAVDDSGAMNRSLLVLVALQESLADPETATLPRRSKRRDIPVWITAEQKEQVRNLARSHSVTQQSLLRHLLFQFINQAPWNKTSGENPKA